MADVVVIGAGVVGAAVAYRLAEAGARVTVLEAERVGGGTSVGSFAWTNSSDKQPREYYELNLAGMRAHAALADEFGPIPWWHGGGSVSWADGDAERAAQRSKLERLQAWGYAGEWITPRQLQELEPDVDLAAVGDAPIAYYPEEGWLDPVPYAHAMLGAARRLGATLVAGARVERVDTTGGRVTGVRTAAGRFYPCDVLINCAGRWADQVADLSGLKLPLAPTVGMLLITPPVAVDVRRIVFTPGCHLRPDGAGRLMLRTNQADTAVTIDSRPDPEHPIADELIRAGARAYPGLAGVKAEAMRIRIRPIPEDGLSAVGPIPGLEGYYVVVTHSGVTLSPFLARAVADEVVRGRQEAQLEPFRPSRFFGRMAAQPVPA